MARHRATEKESRHKSSLASAAVEYQETRAVAASPAGLTVRPIRRPEIDAALPSLFEDDALAPRQVLQQVKSFQKLARQEDYDLMRQMVVASDHGVLQACCFIPNPGKTAFIFTSCPQAEATGLNEMSVSMLNRLVQWALQEGNKLLQVVISPDDDARRNLCLQCGFSPLTDLIYFYHHGRPSPLVLALPDGLRWQSYDAASHELFKSVIARTYQDSLDCPELESIRDMEDVIACHKAAGAFVPRWWKVLFLNDQPVGALILSPLKNNPSMDLTYMGLCPEARGRGLGNILLSEAFQCARQCRCQGVTLAVDSRNHPAYRLYERFGFTEIFRRSVLLQTA